MEHLLLICIVLTSCTFQGDYELTDGKLNLIRAYLPELTERVYTTVYIVNEKTQTLNPTDKNFGKIEIRE